MSKNSKHLTRVRKALVVGVIIAVGAGFGAAANARGWHGDHRDHHNYHYHYHGPHREWRGHHGWAGGYYAPPPVVYGYPYDDPYYYPDYYPPPVVYGPGLSLNFRIH